MFQSKFGHQYNLILTVFELISFGKEKYYRTTIILSEVLKTFWIHRNLKHYMLSIYKEFYIGKIKVVIGSIYNSYLNTYILLLSGTLFTIICVWYSRPATYNTSPLIRPVVTLIADTHQRAGSHVRVANNTFSVAFLTQTANSCNRRIILKTELLFNSYN